MPRIKLSNILTSSIAVLGHAEETVTASKCVSSAIATPELLGAKILNLTAVEVHNHSSNVPEIGGYLPGPLSGLDFCNVTITYTHPGQDDTIHVEVWLPLHGWNGRFQGTGGGGWNTGLGSLLLSPAVANGYAAASTDGGHAQFFDALAAPSSWAQVSPGNVNMYLLQDFASVALNDMTVIGKAVTESYYGKAPSKSYWYGCSTGGRQGLMLAQRYPHAYDGILANAPAINWASFVIAASWAQQVMNQLNVYPSQCELNAFTAEAIKACDALDGLEDGIIATPELCDFDPRSIIDQTYRCDGEDSEHKFSIKAAEVASAVWTGPSSPSRKLGWYGINKDAAMAAYTAATTRDKHGRMTGSSFTIADDWIRYYVTKDPDFSTANLTNDEFFSLLHASRNQYDSIISANDPDLSDFHAAGGKMITWHGLADPLIPAGGSEDYYKKVLALDPKAQDYYRYFEAPGVAHCGFGPGPYPIDAFDKLVEWVEEDVVPDSITAITKNSTVRELCLYPLVQKYVGGDPASPDSFQCVDDRGRRGSGGFVVQP